MEECHLQVQLARKFYCSTCDGSEQSGGKCDSQGQAISLSSLAQVASAFGNGGHCIFSASKTYRWVATVKDPPTVFSTETSSFRSHAAKGIKICTLDKFAHQLLLHSMPMPKVKDRAHTINLLHCLHLLLGRAGAVHRKENSRTASAISRNPAPSEAQQQLSQNSIFSLARTEFAL